MAHVRSTNGFSAPGPKGGVPAVLEFAALDDLGPMARQALIDAPLQMLAYPIVDQIVRMNDLIEQENEARAAAGFALRAYLDPKHPDLDRRIAQGIMSDQLGRMAAERSMQDCLEGFRPLRRISREQRRHR